jgi:DNA-binding transcriptional LysR family regulator
VIDEEPERLPEGYATARRVDLRQMWYAVMAGQQGSVRRAAVLLNVRQSTLSRRIHQLEEQIGIPLFDRSAGGVSPTQAGREFLRIVGRILQEIDDVVRRARSTGRGEVGWLTIGFSTSLASGNLRATLAEFARRFPEVQIGTIEGSWTRLRPALENRQADIAIVTGELTPHRGGSMPLWSERIIVALPEAHPLAEREIIHWTELKGETLLLSQHQAALEIQDILISKLASPEDRPHVVQHDVSRGDIQGLVAAGFGVSLMCEAAVGLHCAGVVYREARDGAGPTRVGYVAHWADNNDNPVLRSFIKLLEERYPPLPADGNDGEP